jgi:quercetin dioxygenase-like cupin family protein
MFYRKDDAGYREVLPGITLKTLAYGDRTLLSEFKLQKGASMPIHNHPHEQTGYLVAGRLRFVIGDESFDATPGCSWSIPSDVGHGADALEDAVVIEVFSPVREDYLP